MLNSLVPVKNKLHRVLIEKSMMHNNDVHMLCTTPDKLQEIRKKARSGGWGSLGVVLERPIYQEEIDAGFDISFDGTASKAMDQKKIPELTKQIDSLYRLKNYFGFHRDMKTKGRSAFNLQDTILNYIATHYYDCMSGGISIWDLVILKTVLLERGYDGTTQIYPSSRGSGDGWLTLDDFLKEVEDIATLDFSNYRLLSLLDV